VEIEVGQREVHEVLLALEAQLAGAGGDRDVAALRAIDVAWLKAPDEVAGPSDARP
jgi:hypothetical protein